MPILYKTEGSWNKTSKLGSGTVPNHDSAMPQEEVIRLAKAGVALLIANHQALRTAREKQRAYYQDIWNLVTGLIKAESGTGGSYEIRITKGIHQFSKGIPGIGQMPHITAKFCPVGSLNGPAVHIWLSMAASPIAGRQLYEARAASASENGPFVPNCTVVQVPVEHRTRVRGNSISQVDLVLLMSEKAEAAL